MTRRLKLVSDPIGVRLAPETWAIVAQLAKERGTSRGEEVRLLVGEALAARRETGKLDLLMRKVDRILAYVLQQEEASPPQPALADDAP